MSEKYIPLSAAIAAAIEGADEWAGGPNITTVQLLPQLRCEHEAGAAREGGGMTNADRIRQMEAKTECCGSCYYWLRRSEKDHAFNRFYCVLPGHSHNIFPDDGPCDEYAPRLRKEDAR